MTSDAADGELCVVGAGLAGIGVAYGLRNDPVDVTILEKSRGVGGRAATRRKHGCHYDHGANYIKDSDERTTALVRELGTEGLVDIAEPVWTFDADGEITPGDRRDAHKWSWTDGITQFAKRLLDRTDATLQKTTRVEALDRTAEGWTLTDTDSEDHGPFEGVVLTPPAPQTAELLAATTITDAAGDDGDSDADGDTAGQLAAAAEAVGDVPFRTIRTFVLQYPFELDYPYYALVNTDRSHEVGWLSRESCKRGHVPDGESLLVVQMAPDWSADQYDEPIESAAEEAAGIVADLLDDDRLREPGWTDDQGWRYALPDDGLDAEVLTPLREEGLFVTGDWLTGEGRVHEAFWNGVDLSATVADRL